LWICAVSLYGQTPDRDTVAALRIMTFNIRYDNPGDSLDAWAYRKSDVASCIRFHKADIVGIQEGLVHQVRYLASALKSYAWCGVGRDDGKEAGEFSAILFNREKVTLIADSTFWLSATPAVPSKGWDAALNRIVTWGKFETKRGGHVFFVFNTHFDHLGIKAREESARLLLQESVRIAHGRPAVLTGNFNSDPREAPYALLTGSQGSSGRLFSDAISVSQNAHCGPLKTYSGFDVHRGIIGEQIDHIFVTDGIRVLEHATLTDFRPEERFLSDHLPVIAEIELP
jgi:endonuclease/exonuclease/phosphatase family metal-dependent hydrolase